MSKDKDVRQRAMARGVGELSDVELLSLVVSPAKRGEEAVEVAERVVAEVDGSLVALAHRTPAELRKVGDLGLEGATKVAAAFELGRRAAAETGVEKMPQMDSPRRVYMAMLPVMRDIGHEECWVLFLNHANRLIGKEMVSKGGMDSTTVDKRVILRRALDRKASGVILVHNHPSGNPYPSVEDIRQTKDLGKALASCDLRLVDHVIIAGRSFYSFSDERVEEV